MDGRDFVIAHIASPVSVRNLLGQPKACLSIEPIVDPSYVLHPSRTTELSQYRSAMEAYIALPIPDGAAA